MFNRSRSISIEAILMNQWVGHSIPPAGLLEQRILEMESMGLVDTEDIEGVPSNLRQYAIASLQRTKPDYFITSDDEMLMRREELESRFGLIILSVYEAMLLLRDANGPMN